MCRLKFWRGLELLHASVGPHPSPSKGSFKKRKIKAYKTSVSFFWSLTMAQAILVPSTAGVIRVLAADRSPMNSQLLTEALTRNRHFALLSAVSASDVLSIMASERPHVAVLSAHLDGNPNGGAELGRDRKSTRLNSSHTVISYAVFCLKKKTNSTGHTSHTGPEIKKP